MENYPGIIDGYTEWKEEHDEGYQYDMIHEFLANYGRGDIQDLFEWAESKIKL